MADFSFFFHFSEKRKLALVLPVNSRSLHRYSSKIIDKKLLNNPPFFNNFSIFFSKEISPFREANFSPKILKSYSIIKNCSTFGSK